MGKTCVNSSRMVFMPSSPVPLFVSTDLNGKITLISQFIAYCEIQLSTSSSFFSCELARLHRYDKADELRTPADKLITLNIVA
jgi:hypothetical protein